MIRRWMKMLLAILLGNVIYFLVMPHLPNVFAHDTYKVDAGLFFDLAMCGMMYAAIRKVI